MRGIKHIVLNKWTTVARGFSAYQSSVAVSIHYDTWRWPSMAETCYFNGEIRGIRKEQLLHYWRTVVYIDVLLKDLQQVAEIQNLKMEVS
jgi:hypothetical protein